MTDTPHLSILMASYNHERFICQAIESLLSQDYSDWELILCDDASTDQTREAVKKFKDPRIHPYFFSLNRQHHMRNFALSKARGRFIGILNSDDLYLPEKLSKQMAHLQSHPETQAVFTHVKCIDDLGDEVPEHPMRNLFRKENQSRHELLRKFFYEGNSLCISTVVMRKEALNFEEIFNPLLVQLSDFDLWLRLCLKGEIYILQEELTAMRFLKGQQNLSSLNANTLNRSILEQALLYKHYLSKEGLDQFEKIFPELEEFLPDKSEEWKTYLICQEASSLERYPARMFGFQSLQKLLEDPQKRKILGERNPRLMKNFFVSEGCGCLAPFQEAVEWVFGWLLESSFKKKFFSFWKNHGDFGKLYFSLPCSPGRNNLGIKPGREGLQIPFSCLRVFGQQTGKMLWQFTKDSSLSDLKIDESISLQKTSTGWLLESRGPSGFFYLPEVETSSDLWLDIEIDLSKIPLEDSEIHNSNHLPVASQESQMEKDTNPEAISLWRYFGRILKGFLKPILLKMGIWPLLKKAKNFLSEFFYEKG